MEKVFKDAAAAEEVFGDLWNRIFEETDIANAFKEKGISLLIECSDPDVAMYVDENGPVLGAEVAKMNPVVTMKMSLDTAHLFWLNKVNIAKALAMRKIRAKGPVQKVLAILPILKPGQEMYPSFCEKYDLPMK